MKNKLSRFRRKFSSIFTNKHRKKTQLLRSTAMSALDNNEIGATVEVDLNDSLANVIKKKRVPKRILHFSDGTMEEYDSDSDTDVKVETKDGSALDTTVPIDPKELSWPQWVKHYTVTGGSKALNVMDKVGENVAYYLGITTPKYQYEIDEYYRAREEHLAAKKLEEIEFQTWESSPNPNTAGQVITEEQKPMHPSMMHQPKV